MVATAGGAIAISAEDGNKPRYLCVQSRGDGIVPWSWEQMEHEMLTEIAALPQLPRERLLYLAEKHKPPQSWYDEEDDLF